MHSGRKTRLLAVAPNRPESAAIEQAVAVLQNGGLVVVPTDTVYGLCCDAANEKAVTSIYRAKGRAVHVPLIVFVTGIADLEALGVSIPQECRRALEKFWPGPLTAVFPRPRCPNAVAGLKPVPAASRRLPEILAAGGSTIGFRAPDHPVAQAILQKSGLFLASTSANRSGKPSAKTGEEAFQALRGRVDLVLDSGPAPLGRESTVVDFAPSPPRMIRRGVISEQEILRVL
jgi:L-threonylcarbamoyladenylate synthase